MLKRKHDPSYDTDSAMDDFLFLKVSLEPQVDLHIVSQRGEKILKDALNRIRNAKPIDALPNSAFLRGNKYRFTERVDDLQEIEDFEISWKELPDKVFKSGVVPLQASSGCPYECAFCNFTKDRRLNCVKPLDQLVAELKIVYERGARYVWFVDDNFRLGRRDINNVSQRFIEEGIEVFWMTFIRASTLQKANVKLLRLAGCCEVQLGLESADAQILKNMNKKSNPKVYDHVLDKLLSVGINCSSYFIFGFPGETEHSVKRTERFIRKHENPEFKGCLSWSIFPFILSPLSPIYEYKNRKHYNLSGYFSNWRHDTMDSDQANMHIIDTFLRIENSGTIYRGDNQEMLKQLGSLKKKKFQSVRHQLSKAALKNQIRRNEILNSFDRVLSI